MSRLYETEIAQNLDELAGLIDILRRERVTRYLEVGAKFGGSLWRIATELIPRSRVVAVDLPRGTRAWTESEPSLKSCIAALGARGYDAHLIWGDSTSVQVIEQVNRLGPYDAVFIDANHTMPFVRQDWENYGAMARIVAFHDIGWQRPANWPGVRIDVPQHWEHIRGLYKHREFKLCVTGMNNGIGVLWRQ